MPCQQITNTGISYNPPLSSRSGPFTSEAECLQACKEGACCDGATCTVKPQCQCVCTTGSCCGPEIETINGITGPKCRDYTQISRDACIAAGGTWRCNTFCTQWGGDLEFGIQPLPCTSLAGSAEPVFKGVGTTCSPNPCGAKCYRQNGYRAVLYAQASGVCEECRKSKLVGFFPTYQAAQNALSAYQAVVLADPGCVIQSQQIVPVEIAADCYESAPDSTWTLKSTHQTRGECQSQCATDSNCPKGVCIRVTGQCFCPDCPNNPNTLTPCPCDSVCGKGTYYEWECYKFAPGETIADYQWAVDDFQGYEVDWCTETYYNAFHALYMPVDKCAADAAQYWPDATCPLGCRQQPNPLP
jgi:hypothetical protein